MPTAMEELEERFLAARLLPAAPLAAWRTTDPAREAAARAIDAALASDAARGPEPAYHNRHHFAEAAASMALLCTQAVAQGLIGPDLAELGVLAMIGHDIGHDGTLPAPGTLERIAAERVACLASGLDAASVDVLRQVILGTDPTRLAANRAAATAGAPPLAHLCHLANEADVMGSLMPRLGWELSALLAREWRAHDAARADAAESFCGRHGFLALYAPPSATAARLGVSECLATQFAAFAPEGPEGLDALPRGEAMRRYRSRLT